MKKLNCPVCGGKMDVDTQNGIAICKYCGCKVQMFDHSELKREEKTFRIVDEARQKEVEAKQKEIDLSFKKLEFEKEEQEREAHKNKSDLIIGLCSLFAGVLLLTIGSIFSTNSADNTQIDPISYLILPGIAGTVVGIIFLCNKFSKKKKDK